MKKDKHIAQFKTFTNDQYVPISWTLEKEKSWSQLNRKEKRAIKYGK